MSEIGNTIRAMRARGMSCDMILDAIETMADVAAAAKDHALEERRANDRARNARWRASQKELAKANVSNAEKREEALAESPSPLVSPLLPSPKPLTNNPPIIPPTCENPPARSKRKSEQKTRLAADWVLPIEFIEWARGYRDPNHPEIQLTDEEIQREGHSIRDWSANSPNGAKIDWLAAWRNWIREQATKIIRARPRASGTAAARRPATTSQFAPDISLFDALAVAGIEASHAGANAGWSPDTGDRAGAARRSASVEILDRGDARGTDARRTGGDRSGAGAVVLPLPLAGVG